MSRFDSIEPKIKRAYKHVSDLEDAIIAFKETNPGSIGAKKNSKTGQIQYCVVEAPNVPLEISLIAGDILQNLRSALDYLAFRLVEANGKIPDSNTSFPIADSFGEYKTQSARKIKLMSHSAIDAINSIKPYKGGNDTLWRLHRLNNIDKHRLLLMVGVVFSSFDAFGYFKRIGVMPPHLNTEGMRWRRRNVHPLKAGDVLFTSPSTEVDENIEFTVEIAVNELGICECEPLIETLHGMAQLVNNLISDFIPLL
jgi:hypothetical protein